MDKMFLIIASFIFVFGSTQVQALSPLRAKNENVSFEKLPYFGCDAAPPVKRNPVLFQKYSIILLGQVVNSALPNSNSSREPFELGKTYGSAPVMHKIRVQSVWKGEADRELIWLPDDSGSRLSLDYCNMAGEADFEKLEVGQWYVLFIGELIAHKGTDYSPLSVGVNRAYKASESEELIKWLDELSASNPKPKE